MHSDENFDEIIKKIAKKITRHKVPKPAEKVPVVVENLLIPCDEPSQEPVEEPCVEPVEDPSGERSEGFVEEPSEGYGEELSERNGQEPSEGYSEKPVDDLNIAETSANIVCQYQSVIQFAGRSQTSPKLQVPEVIEERSKGISSPVSVPLDNSDNIEKHLQKKFNNELRVELVEPNEPKISNMSIYRQLLSPYLKPPPNLDFRNGAQEQHKHRGFQSERPMRKDNVDIYRSILMSTPDDGQQLVIRNNSNDSHDNEKSSTSKTESFVIHGQSSEYFSEMHWRKRTSQCFNQMEQ